MIVIKFSCGHVLRLETNSFDIRVGEAVGCKKCHRSVIVVRVEKE